MQWNRVFLPFNHLLELKKKTLQQLVESVVVGPAPLAGADLHKLLGVSGAAFRSNSIIIHVGKTMGLWKNSPSALHINQFFDLRGVNFFPQN